MKIKTAIMRIAIAIAVGCIIGFCAGIEYSVAEQVVWNNDSNINITDSWKDIDGTPLTGAFCTWFVYNHDGTLIESGIHTEIAEGSFNFTVSQLVVPNVYPLLFNCTKLGFNGTSSKDSIKIVDELTEDFKDNLEEINRTTNQINITTHETNRTTYEINLTVNQIVSILEDDINVTLNNILTNVNFTLQNVSNLSNELSTILTSLDEHHDLLVLKWGSDDADEITDKLKDLKSQIKNLEFRFSFISNGELEQRTLSIQKLAKETNQKLGEEGFDFRTWIFPVGCLLFFIILIIVLVSKSKKKKSPPGLGLSPGVPNARY